jgi:outer membrane protein
MIMFRTSSIALMIASVSSALGTQRAAADSADESSPSTWQFTAGLGAMSRPRFPGSDRTRYLALPMFNVSYGRFFFGDAPGSGSGGGLGVNLYQDSHWRLGASISGDFVTPRKESDDPRLHGLGDVSKTARASLFAAYTLNWATLRTNVSSDIAGHGEGTLVAVDLEGHYHPIERLTLSAGPGFTWASGPYMHTFFGISAAQSAASGLPQFEPGGGVDTIRFSLAANYRLATAWNLGARASLSRLRGDAADSPITESRNQNAYALFAAYHF